MSAANQSMGINDGNAQEPTLAPSPKAAPTAGGVAAPGASPKKNTETPLTRVADYVMFHAPHSSECASRIPFSPPRGFERRQCDCSRLQAISDVTAARVDAGVLQAQNAELVKALTALVASLDIPGIESFVAVAHAKADARAILLKVRP